MGSAGGEEGGAPHRGGHEPQPRVPAHPRAARIPIGRFQGGPGRRQPCRQGGQGESVRVTDSTLSLTKRCEATFFVLSLHCLLVYVSVAAVSILALNHSHLKWDPTFKPNQCACTFLNCGCYFATC